MVGNTPHWENYLPKIAIRNLRGSIENNYTSISLNKNSIADDERQKNFFSQLNRDNVEYISIINFLCKKEELPYSCLVGFKGRDGSLKLTSYDKSHLTFETTQLLKNKIFKSIIK